MSELALLAFAFAVGVAVGYSIRPRGLTLDEELAYLVELDAVR